jgi:hypothetical protein
MSRTGLLLILSLLLVACAADRVVVEPVPDTTSVLHNPLNGWVLYAHHSPENNFWERRDSLFVPSLGQTVSVADYAGTLYIRSSWTMFNPREDEYGWDSDPKLKMLIDGAIERGMKLAFRVVPDSRDEPMTHTPAFVMEAGAKGFETMTGHRKVWSPYPDDPVFVEKFEKFVEAFGAKFDNPDMVAFVDGFGLGLWGETHDMKYLDPANREKVFKWVIDLYSRHFTKVPLAINYHRLIGTRASWQEPDPDSERLLDYAFGKGYILRHDAFGMSGYYQQWERDIAKKWRFTRPLIMEGGWVTNHHDITLDPRGYKTIADVREGEFADAREAHANMMDLRIMEFEHWFGESFHLVEKFISEGGYRLFPERLSLPVEIRSGETTIILHSWSNLGWGYFPNNIPQWNYKYKVAFALLDGDGTANDIFVDTEAEPSLWLNGESSSYSFTPRISLEPGRYVWALGIVDTSKGNRPGVKLAVKGETTADGWLRLKEMEIR